MKNVLLKISLALTLIIGLITPAATPTKAATISYLLNPASTYEYTDAYGNFSYAYSDKFNEYDWWKSSRWYLFVKETNAGLYEKNVPTHTPVQALAYPIVNGKKWDVGIHPSETGSYRQIESANSTVTTPAGTFKNVVVVKQEKVLKDHMGKVTHTVTKHYYAPYAGEILRKDAAGKTLFQLTKATNLKVLDLTPPSVPTISSISDHSTYITGAAESKSKVYAWVGSKKLGETTAASGKYSIKISKQKAGTVVSVYSIDAARNKSRTRTFKVLDKTAPKTPTVNKVTSKTVYIKGKAEKKATVYVYNKSKKIGSVKVDSKGNYKVKIKKQKKKSKLTVYVKDSAGNKSKVKSVKVY